VTIKDTGSRHTVGVKEAARLLGCSEASAYRGVHEGVIPTIKMGKRLLIPKAALAKLLGVEPEVLGVRVFESRLRAQEVESENGTQFDALSNGGGPMED